MLPKRGLAPWLAPILAVSWCGVALAEKDESETSTASWTLKLPELSGFIQVHYRQAFETGEDNIVDVGNFRVQRVRIALKGEVLPWLTYNLSIDPRAPEIRGILRNAFIGVHLIPKHEIRFGQQKTQFGYENSESSSELFVVNRAEVSDNLARGENLRDLGLGIIGRIKLGAGFRIEDAITVVNGSGLNVQADDTPFKNVFGRLGLRYKYKDLRIRLGVSGAVGDQKERGDDLESDEDDYVFDFKRIGGDLQIDWTWFFLAAEYVFGVDDIPEHTILATDEAPQKEIVPAESADVMGYYVLLAGKTPWSVGPVVRFDALVDALGEEFQRLTFGVYYGLPKEVIRLLVLYELRLKKDDMRGDDKLYLWAQVTF